MELPYSWRGHSYTMNRLLLEKTESHIPIKFLVVVAEQLVYDDNIFSTLYIELS